MRTLVASAVLVVATAVAAPSAAQTWGEIEIPGGVTAARAVLGLGTGTRTPSAFLIDFIRTYHQFGDVDSTAVDRFARYVRYVQDLRLVLAGWRDGLELGRDRLRGVQQERWRHVAETLGLRLREVKNRPVVEPDRDDQAIERRAWLAALGIDATRVAQQLNQGDRVRLVVNSDMVPLPVPALWPTLLEKPGPADLVRLGTSHRAALIYMGLVALDSETLTWIAAHPRVLDLDTVEAGTFAAFGRSVRVRGSRVEPAGGSAFAPVWVQLVDQRLEEPVEFIRRLVGKDDGRLAFLYDTVAQADPRLQTALFDGATRTEPRIEAFERHYRWFREVDPSWNVGTRPFFRPAIDPSLVLALLDVGPDGRVGPDWWPDVLDAVAGDDGWPARPLREIRDRRAGVTWALSWIFDSQAPQARFRLLRFAQRRFATAPRTAAAPVEIALRGFERMPALLLALERMGVATPPAFAEVVSAAMRVTLRGDLHTAGPKLREWQAAAALLEQILRHRAVPASVRDGLLTSLAAIVPADDDLPSGAVAGWLAQQLMPALGAPDADSKDVERVAIGRWLAPAEQPVRTLNWEGLDYRIDRVGPVVRDAVAVRAAAQGPTLAHLVALVGVRRELQAGVTTTERAHALGTQLDAVRTAVLQLRDEKHKPRFETDDLQDVARALSRSKRPRDLERLARQTPKLGYTFDVLTAQVLPSLVYALAASPAPQPQIFADAADRHLITASPGLPPEQWRRSAWTLPATGTLPTGGSGVLGSLLALDTALGEGQLRRLAAGDAPAPPVEGTFTPQDRAGFVDRLLLPSTLEDIEAMAEPLAAALTAGSRRWAEVTAAAGSARGTAESLLTPVLGATRTNLVLWLLDRKRAEAAADLMLPSERLRLGVPEATPLPVAAGPASAAFDGCLCLRPPPSQPIEFWLGRGDSGQLSVLTTDLVLRVSVALAELKLPAALTELVLPFAVQDLIDRVAQFAPHDWEALAVSRFIAKERVEDYVLALVAEGLLAPPTSAEPVRRR